MLFFLSSFNVEVGILEGASRSGSRTTPSLQSLTYEPVLTKSLTLRPTLRKQEEPCRPRK